MHRDNLSSLFSLSNANAIITLRSLYAYYAPRMTFITWSTCASSRPDVMTRAINVLGVISPRPTVVTTIMVVMYGLLSVPKCDRLWIDTVEMFPPVGTKHHEQYDRYT
jgi:hypothetical protein